MSLLLLLTPNPNVSSKLYLRSTQSNGIGSTYYDLDIVAGALSDTAVVDTALNGTEIQFTKTAGGAIAQFISGRAPVGGFTLTRTDISVWLAQSSLLNNAGGRYRIFKRTAAGVETDITGTPFDNGIEATAVNAEYTWSGNVTDTVFAEDDRVLLKVYVTNIGVMAMGTVTLNFNAADGLAGDSFLTVYPKAVFKANAGGSTGVLIAQGSVIAGAANRTTLHSATGSLVGQGSVISGTAVHNIPHTSSGALIGQGSLVAGVAARTLVHPSSGGLVGQGSVITGSANHATAHAATGVLAGQGTVIAGVAARSGGVILHDGTGALVAQGTAITGAAARSRIHNATADLIAQGSLVTGSANRTHVFNAIGALVAQGSVITGAAVHNLLHVSSGALIAQGSIISSAAQNGLGTAVTQDYINRSRRLLRR